MLKGVDTLKGWKSVYGIKIRGGKKDECARSAILYTV